MKDILETMIKHLVENEQAVSIEEINQENNVTFEVTVAKEDMGKVIGRQGKMAKAIRTFMKAMGSKEQKNVTIQFVG